MKRSTWIAIGAIAGVAGIGVSVAIAEHGSRYHGGGYHGERGESEGFEGRGHHRGGWRKARTKDEILARARSKFAEFDADSDGMLQRGEIEKMLERRAKRWRRGRGERMLRRFERRMARADIDRDGKVTPEEVRARAEQRFARMDLDGDGRITDADLPPMLRGRGILSGDAEFRPRRRRVARKLAMLRRANKDGDDVLTRDEVVEFAAGRFKRWDRNGDNVIDSADREVAQRERKDYRIARFLHRFGATEAGEVDRDAYLKRAEERFDRRDIDGDGELSREEMRSWRGKGRGGHGRGHHGGGERGWHRRHHGGEGDRL